MQLEQIIDRANALKVDKIGVISMLKLQCAYDAWKQIFPNIVSYYAVKSNQNDEILKFFIQNNCGFDCATPNEVKRVLFLGASVDKIVYANTIKSEFQLEQTTNLGVELMTFDNDDELMKLKNYKVKLLLRVQPPDENPEFNKCGATIDEAKELIQKCQLLKLNLVGFAFHVGCFGSINNFTNTIQMCVELQHYGKQIGLELKMLDIGGGFWFGDYNQHFNVKKIPQNELSNFNQLINTFQQVIAEPGRFFSGSIGRIYLKVIGRKISHKNNKIDFVNYYLADGLHGVFANILIFKTQPKLTLFKKGEEFKSCFYGPTCNGGDCIQKNVMVPLFEVNDWVMCEDFGAYSSVCGSEFNGFEPLQWITE